MKKIVRILLVMILCIGLVGCQTKEKNSYTGTYTLKYFYVEGCSNCEYFSKNGLPLIEEEFGDHMEIIKYNMDDRESVDEVRNAYDEVVNNIIDFKNLLGKVWLECCHNLINTALCMDVKLDWL